MAQTTALISKHLPIELAKIVLSFFGEPTNEFDCAVSGLWEYCLNISDFEKGLQGACYGGNIILAKKFLRKGIRKKMPGSRIRLKTALCFAIKGGQLKLINYMVKNNAEVGFNYVYFKRNHSVKIAQYFVKNCGVKLK